MISSRCKWEVNMKVDEFIEGISDDYAVELKAMTQEDLQRRITDFLKYMIEDNSDANKISVEVEVIHTELQVVEGDFN